MKKTISGIRGVAGRDLSLVDVMGFCNSFSVLAAEDCILARDTRPSGAMICGAAAAALMQNGMDVHDLGVAPTPVAFRESRRYGAALNVTSSHNPVEWNGLKFALGGRGINSRELETVLRPQETPKDAIGSYGTAESSYIDDAAELVGPIDGSPDILVDAGGGAAAGVAPALLERIGCRVRTINGTLAESTRGPDPTSDGLADLTAAGSTADVGFAFDLDGDRLVIVRGGRRLSPDATLGLGIAKALDMGYKRYVLSIDTSVAVERIIRQGGGSAKRSKVGEANVVEMIQETGAQAGGEGSSAGFILPEFNYCRDGILAGGLVASMLDLSDMDEVVSFMESYHQVRDAVALDSDRHDATLGRIAGRMAHEYSETVDIDGIKGIADEDSWVLVRASNTEDVIRVSAESNRPGRARLMADSVKRMVAECHG